MANIDELKQYKHIHLIGIGGVSMSGIAEILHSWGFIVTGSDANESETTEKLKKNLKPGNPCNIKVFQAYEGI